MAMTAKQQRLLYFDVCNIVVLNLKIGFETNKQFVIEKSDI
jgi:hypothetical protein